MPVESTTLVGVGRAPSVPAALKRGSFSIGHAALHGVSKQQLRGASWHRLGAGFYAWREIAGERSVLLASIAQRMPQAAVFSGRTAAWIHGLDVDPCPVEITMPVQSCVSHVAGVRVRRSNVAADEIRFRRDLITTSPVRTFADIARREPLVDAVILLDMAAHRRTVSLPSLVAWAAKHRNYRGLKKLHAAVDLAEPATESPMESRLRLLLVLAGLPRPGAQVTIRDHAGAFVARPDLFYPTERLAIEYDGAGHRESLISDDRRQNRIVDAGYRVLRFTAHDVLVEPDAVVALVRRTLATKPPIP